jgi:hypothetical protein
MGSTEVRRSRALTRAPAGSAGQCRATGGELASVRPRAPCGSAQACEAERCAVRAQRRRRPLRHSPQRRETELRGQGMGESSLGRARLRGCEAARLRGCEAARLRGCEAARRVSAAGLCAHNPAAAQRSFGGTEFGVRARRETTARPARFRRHAGRISAAGALTACQKYAGSRRDVPAFMKSCRAVPDSGSSGMLDRSACQECLAADSSGMSGGRLARMSGGRLVGNARQPAR